MKKIFSGIANIFKVPELRKKILFTAIILVVYRIGCQIPIPFLNKSVLASLVSQGGGSLFGLVDVFTGGAFSNATIFALSISPYINASIIIQLLCVAFDSLGKLAKEGDEGRKKIDRITRYSAIGLALVEAVAITWGIHNSLSNFNFFIMAVVVLTMTAGTALIVWLGDLVTEKGISNGISLIIFVNIISRGPSAVSTMISYYSNGLLGNKVVGILIMALVVVVFLAVIGCVVWVNEAERRLPVKYAKRVVGSKMYGGQATYVPIKVCWAGVLPIIFAMSIMVLPSTIVSFIWPSSTNAFIVFLRDQWTGGWVYNVVYAVLIVAFTFFYTYIQFNPVDLANNIQSNGGFIPGIRPGRETAAYITKVLHRLTWFSGMFLAVVQLFPSLLGTITGINGLWLGGSSVFIMVGVALEVVRSAESMMIMRHHSGFLED
ncbi:MAG: preprotein translocase subunit SecY [Clostridia bacterium]|nr:preprotein translocase subunit SecY [Clostridia bacterium]